MTDAEYKGGYAYEYIHKVAEYNGWNYQYVYGEWPELFSLLENGGIDLLAGVSKTEERLGKFLYPDELMGNEHYVLYQHSSDKSMSVSDLSSFKGKRIGAIANNLMTTCLENWLRERNAEAEIVYFDSFGDRDQAFEEGTIDALVTTDNGVLLSSGYAQIARVGEEAYYLAVTKGREDLLQDLNQSLEYIKDIDSYFLSNLEYRNYGTTLANSTLSSREEAWLENHRTLVMGYLENYIPYCGTDKDGKVYGLITDVMDAILSELHISDRLSVTYRSFSDGGEMVDALKRREIDAAFPVGGENWQLEQKGIKSTNDLVTSTVNLVHKGSYQDLVVSRIVVTHGNTMMKDYLLAAYPNAEIMECASIEECLRAVLSGKADATTINGLRVDLIKLNRQYNDLTMTRLDKTSGRCLGVAGDNTGLQMLLNRGIKLIGQDFASNAAFNYMSSLYQVTLTDFLADHMALFGGAITLFLIVILSMGSYVLLLQRRKNLELSEKQKKLEEISSEQESQLEEISLLNNELEEHQSQLEESAAEQEAQLTEIQALNDQLKDNLERTNIFAAMSHEYESVHVADLDAGTFTTIRSSLGMDLKHYEMEPAPYWESVKNLVECFVLPETRDDFLKFLKPEAMKRRMEEEKVFSYRYGIIPDESGNYVYEMDFVSVGEDKSRHLLVLGARCIDNILQFEREEGQYNAALLNECAFYFSFDVSNGILENDFATNSNYQPLKELEISFPISYDEFCRICIEKLGLRANTEKEASYWTLAGLRHAFEEGKSSVLLRHESQMSGRAWESTIILSQDPTCHRLHAVYICKDITEMMKAELENKRILEKAKKDAEAANNAKTVFLFNMSHDIRTPMNAIIGFRDLLEKHQEDPVRRKDYLKKIEDSSQVLLSIINNVLEMARIESGRVEIDESAWSAEQFNDTLYSIFHEMMAAKGIAFTRQIQVKNTYVYCDPTKLREVFINILSNAYKYTQPGGSVNMLLEEIPSSRPGYAMYRTTVTDTGIGMSEEFLPHIFEEFSRECNTTDNKIEGTGLGMPIVKRLVNLMEGTIEVQSQQGIGTTVVVTIPHRITERTNLINRNVSGVKGKSFEGKRILLAEDNDLNAEIAIEMLEEAGFLVERAEDGVICCDRMEKAESGYYDLILMDIQMPNRNGYETTTVIRGMADEGKAHIPILAMTANAFEEDKREALRVGMNGHLTKPVRASELMKVLASILE